MYIGSFNRLGSVFEIPSMQHFNKTNIYATTNIHLINS